jgi:o-succinylbenzoate---CoA ligase
MKTPWELFQQRDQSWLTGVDAGLIESLARTRYESLLQQGVMTVVLVEPDQARFLAGFLAAASVPCRLVLGNPDWSQKEWQQVCEMFDLDSERDVVWGTQVLSSGQSPPSPQFCGNRVVSKSPRIGGLGSAPTGIYIPTGGSSGQLRFAIHTWETLSAAVSGFQAYFEIQNINSCCLLPLHHVSGLMQFVRALLTDGQLVIHPWKALESGQLPPTLPDDCFLSLVPTQLSRLLKTPHWPWLRQFQAILLGGAPAWESLLAEARELGLPLAPTYGMTETAGQIATLKPLEFLAGRSGCGRPLPHATLTVGDDQGQPVPVGTVGHLMVQADALMVGYFPSEPIGDGNAFRSDDLARFDDAGYLHILGRTSSKIITGGENVFPAAVEAAIRATDLVQDICVLGWPDADWGQIVVAAYVPATTTVTPQQIQTALTGHLARYQWPRRWIARSALPRNAQGKVALPTLKTQLEKEFAPVSPSA